MTKWLVGVIPAAIAAVVATLVSLPLRSPDDAILNSGTVTIGTLIAGFAIGAAWTAFSTRPVVYAGIAAAALAAAIAMAVVLEAELSDSFAYIAPLALLVFTICGVLTPLVHRLLTERRLQVGGSIAGLVLALAAGLGLASQGDHEAKHLSFPEARATPVATQTIAAGTTPAETPSTPSSSGAPATAADLEGVTYTVVTDESTVQYTVTEKLSASIAESEAQGTTGAIGGEIHLDGQPSTISFDASTFVSDQDRRDNVVRQIFDSDPNVTFVVVSLSGLPGSYTAGQEVRMSVTGTATILGVSRPLTFDVTGKFDGDELQLLGTTNFTWADFNIDPPNNPFVTVHNDVNIEVLIIARPA